MREKTFTGKIQVAILDDHQSIIDGYMHRLSKEPDIEIVGNASHAEEFEILLDSKKPDVLILDVVVPTSWDNPNPYPILQTIPKWLQRYPNLSILVISMHLLRTLVKAVMEAGASGYILKDDRAAITDLGSIIRAIANGGVYFSKQAQNLVAIEWSEKVHLSPRQLEVLSLCAAYPDSTTAELADILGVAHSTVRNLLSSAYLRLNVQNRTAAILKARELGLITPQQPSIGI